MKIFAKLFETELGQILVKKDTNEEDDSEIRFYFTANGLGVCSSAYTYKNEDSAINFFENITKESATSAVKGVMVSLDLDIFDEA